MTVEAKVCLISFFLFTHISVFVLLTDYRQILACGSNAFGQLGVGETTKQTVDLLVVEVSP